MKSISRSPTSISVPIALFPHCLYRFIIFISFFSYPSTVFLEIVCILYVLNWGIDTLHTVLYLVFLLNLRWSSLQPHGEICHFPFAKHCTGVPQLIHLIP